jgi:succinate-semialdehyde dehydrogenase
MVKAAYSSGTPAYGVGPGNPPVVLDRGYDINDAVKKTIVAVGSDNGILCDGDNQLLYPEDEEAELFAALRKEGVVIFEKKADVEAFGKVLFHDGKANSALVGKDAPVIAEVAGLKVPAKTKVIGLKLDVFGKANVLNKEIMGPIVILKSYDTFENATALAIQNMVESGGIGHTAGIFSNNKKHIDYYAERIPVARVLVNQPTPDAWGPSTNGLTPAVSESCGTWGNNILCGNVDYIHMMNVSKIAMPIKEKAVDGAKLFKD